MLSAIFTFYIFIIMSFITKIHMYWLKGGFWPGKDKQDFIDKVLGQGSEVPSAIAYVFVLLSFAFMATFPLAVYYGVDMGIKDYQKYVFLILSIIFITRALGMFIPFVAKKATKIFLEYNKKYYAPLCFSLGVSYLYLFYIN